jgi:hypothetical protein
MMIGYYPLYYHYPIYYWLDPHEILIPPHLTREDNGLDVLPESLAELTKLRMLWLEAPVTKKKNGCGKLPGFMWLNVI